MQNSVLAGSRERLLVDLGQAVDRGDVREVDVAAAAYLGREDDLGAIGIEAGVYVDLLNLCRRVVTTQHSGFFVGVTVPPP